MSPETAHRSRSLLAAQVSTSLQSESNPRCRTSACPRAGKRELFPWATFALIRSSPNALCRLPNRFERPERLDVEVACIHHWLASKQAAMQDRDIDFVFRSRSRSWSLGTDIARRTRNRCRVQLLQRFLGRVYNTWVASSDSLGSNRTTELVSTWLVHVFEQAARVRLAKPQ